MSVSVKFFASLRETIGKSEYSVEAPSDLTAADVWSLSTNNAELPANTLVAINMDYVDIRATVKDGDEIAFFPPVTGG